MSGIVSCQNPLDGQLTVWANLYSHGRFIGSGAKGSRRRSDELRECFSCSRWSKSSIYTLSGGMAQRLKVARAIFHSPAVLLFDEPTAGPELTLGTSFETQHWPEVQLRAPIVHHPWRRPLTVVAPHAREDRRPPLAADSGARQSTGLRERGYARRLHQCAALAPLRRLPGHGDVWCHVSGDRAAQLSTSRSVLTALPPLRSVRGRSG